MVAKEWFRSCAGANCVLSVPTVRRCHCHLSKRQLVSSIRMQICNTEPTQLKRKRFQQSTNIIRSCIAFIFAEFFFSRIRICTCSLYLYAVTVLIYIAWNSGLYRYSNSFQWYARPGGAYHWWEKSPTCPSTHLTGTSLSINLILMTWLYYTIYADNLMKWMRHLEIGGHPQTFQFFPSK